MLIDGGADLNQSFGDEEVTPLQAAAECGATIPLPPAL